MEKVDMPITGICSFAKYPVCCDISSLNADMAVLGVPYDLGVGFLSGSRLGPRRIREASTQYSRGDRGFYDPELDRTFLGDPWKIMDCGDADIIHGDVAASFENIETSVRAILGRNSTPVVLGGDHSISIPVARALDELPHSLGVIQLDAHLDWSKAPGGQLFGNGSPMRRMSEMPHIGPMVQIGLRGMGSSRKEDFDDARSYGSRLFTASDVRRLGADEIVRVIPPADAYYVTIDIDVFDISLAPGTGSPMPAGLLYQEVAALLREIASAFNVICIDLVEVAPQYDPSTATCRIAAMTLLEFMGHILERRRQQGRTN
jgi:agmatinase